MLLQDEELKKLFHGYLRFKKKGGYFSARRFTKEQENYLKSSGMFYSRAICSASVTLEFITTAERFSFEYKLFSETGVMPSGFEVYEDGFLTGKVPKTELKDCGALSFALGKGKKKVVVYIPYYSEYGIKNFDIDGEYEFVRRGKNKVLFLGDSITQGAGTAVSGGTYVNTVSREFGYEILNQGIGGFVYDKNILKELPFKPKKIVVAYGTNDIKWRTPEQPEKSVPEFYDRLDALYPHVKKLVILPPFKSNDELEILKAKFKRIVRIIRDTVASYDGITVVSAYEMIPHFSEYYLADRIHPNALGAAIYAENLIKEIKRIKF